MIKKEKIIFELKKIIDPHLNKDIWSSNLVTKIKIKKNIILLNFKPTTPFCPLIDYFVSEIKERLESLEDVDEVKIKIK